MTLPILYQEILSLIAYRTQSPLSLHFTQECIELVNPAQCTPGLENKSDGGPLHIMKSNVFPLCLTDLSI